MRAPALRVTGEDAEDVHREPARSADPGISPGPVAQPVRPPLSLREQAGPGIEVRREGGGMMLDPQRPVRLMIRKCSVPARAPGRAVAPAVMRRTSTGAADVYWRGGMTTAE